MLRRPELQVPSNPASPLLGDWSKSETTSQGLPTIIWRQPAVRISRRIAGSIDKGGALLPSGLHRFGHIKIQGAPWMNVHRSHS